MGEEQSREDRAAGVLHQLWLKNRPVTLERFSVVAAALAALSAGDLDADRRQEAMGEAHKLRGILGTYGFAEGSVLAGEAEDTLDGKRDGEGARELADRLLAYAGTLPDS